MVIDRAGYQIRSYSVIDWSLRKNLQYPWLYEHLALQKSERYTSRTIKSNVWFNKKIACKLWDSIWHYIRTKMRLNPNDIRYTQNSISGQFSNGLAIETTFYDLLNGFLSPDSIASIEVVMCNGTWWALTGNRRLFLYKQLEELGLVDTIPVVQRSPDRSGVMNQLRRRMTTRDNGYSIRCRQPTAQVSIDSMTLNWRLNRRSKQRQRFRFDLL